ncbi:helix-turn-helix transcriptional regulator [Pontibacter sp. BT731]|uniref:helix-turn-helix domain-containing protein n=1 Tax=Pontibacter coccineus TaxID=3063328 RepID=UPI0026E16AEE|nr:helix-turn-helix transcriptional regulator [Pontibacter sp. BT731]MDO6392068.1 helix-turn-helix transcriptional regulator [Pontibacter sp. BT731]
MKNPSGIQAFGIHLRRLREAHGMSQQELAYAADVSKLTIQRTENAKYSVTLDVLVSLAKGLRVSLPELLDFELPEESV